MKIGRFEDIQAWQKAKTASLSVYKAFEGCKDFKFKDQIQSAAISVMNNIAEGFERKGVKELERFLYIAKGSAGEVRSMLYVALDLKYISPDSFKVLSSLYIEISKMLAGFIRSL
ncbi:MAG: four helix bundle protein [Patescibacteria group bacterium]|nr:four helix bundle protein [Patescibacteria group bacterium]